MSKTELTIKAILLAPFCVGSITSSLMIARHEFVDALAIAGLCSVYGVVQAIFFGTMRDDDDND